MSMISYLIKKIYEKKTRDQQDLDLFVRKAREILARTDEISTIVQVGANDGITNDPIYPIIKDFGEKIRVILIEPQASLIPILERNYQFHKNKIILNLAIGQKGTLQLYTVEEDYWEKLDVPYAIEWPIYRAPTGICSEDKDYVLAWLNRYLKNPDDSTKAVKSFSIQSMPMTEIFEISKINSPLSILQVDAEGFDDEVIYHSNISVMQPEIINFEHKHIGHRRLRKLRKFLDKAGYDVKIYGPENAIALRRNLADQ